jgi:hypothetical protein
MEEGSEETHELLHNPSHTVKCAVILCLNNHYSTKTQQPMGSGRRPVDHAFLTSAVDGGD